MQTRTHVYYVTSSCCVRLLHVVPRFSWLQHCLFALLSSFNIAYLHHSLFASVSICINVYLHHSLFASLSICISVYLHLLFISINCLFVFIVFLHHCLLAPLFAWNHCLFFKSPIFAPVSVCIIVYLHICLLAYVSMCRAGAAIRRTRRSPRAQPARGRKRWREDRGVGEMEDASCCCEVCQLNYVSI